MPMVSAEEDTTDPDGKTWGIAPVGLPFYSPETGFGGAVSILTYWNAQRNAARPDSASLTAAYTEKGQFFTGLNVKKYFMGDTLFTTGNVGFRQWKNTFYGINGVVPEGFTSDFEEEYESSSVNLKGGLAFKMKEGAYLGGQWTMKDTDMESFEDDGWLPGSGLPGLDGGQVSGPGIFLTIDNRDEAFYPSRGVLLNMEYNWYHDDVGSDYDYEALEVDFRVYHSLRPGHILASQIELTHTHGDLPFYELPSLSTRESMRGIEAGRYIAENRYALQTEYRFPIWRRFGGVVFAGGGHVAPEFGDLLDDIRFAGGIGLRYTIETKKHINFRFDIGFDEDGETSVYFTMREAF